MKYHRFHKHESRKVLYNLFSSHKLNVVYYLLKIFNIKIYNLDDNSKIICNYNLNNSNLILTEARAETSKHGADRPHIGADWPHLWAVWALLCCAQSWFDCVPNYAIFSDWIFISWLRCASPTLIFLYTFLCNMWRQTYTKIENGVDKR